MRHLLIFILAVLLPWVFAFSQVPSDNVRTAVARLEWTRQHRPVEGIHLHFDKPYYSSGDTIFFKAYVTMNEQHRPTPLSEVVHVDLIDPAGGIIQSIKLQLKRGSAYGNLELADSLRAGRYRLRAYTRWMLNKGGGAFFFAAVPVGEAGKPWQERSPRLADSGRRAPAAAAGVQFFPEGGVLIAGLETKVVFKATGKNGWGVKAKGVVVDDQGKEITRFQQTHLGMGFLYLRPETGRTYQAKVTTGDGETMTTDLPKAASAGMVLAVENDSVVHVLTSDAYLQAHPQEAVTLLISSRGGNFVMTAPLKEGELSFLIDHQKLHSGIARLTLFSSQGEPVSERLLFIKGADSLHLAVQSDKPVYRQREKVELTIAAQGWIGDAAQANFSVSVTNENLLKPDENNEETMLSDLLLSSDLKGPIEQPGYYFAHSGDAVDANIDLLLLTQGYRHFAWAPLLQDSVLPLTYKAEKYLQIRGVVRTSSGKAVKDETVTLSDTSGRGPEQTTKTDTAGHFVFGNLVFTDTMHFLLRASRSGSVILLDGVMPPPVTVAPAVEWAPEQNAAMSAYLATAAQEHRIAGNARAKLLRPVVVTAWKSSANYETQSFAGAGNADQVLHAGDFKFGPTLGIALDGQLVGVEISGDTARQIGSKWPMLVVVDGIDQGNNLGDINLADVETVEVLKSGNASAYGVEGAGGVLVITTKKGGELQPEPEEGGGLYGAFMGFSKGHEFYMPQYGVKEADESTPDLRSTVCWQPEVMVDKDGKASVSFYNSDLKGMYRVVVEGIDASGNLTRQVCHYRVE